VSTLPEGENVKIAHELHDVTEKMKDEYVRATVLLALVLFLAALSQRFERLAVRGGLLVLGFAIMLFGLANIAMYPIIG
jgi:hypothetical protein